MSHVYISNRVVGSSSSSIDDAIATAVATAAKTIRNLEWFEVKEVRGHIKDGRVAHYQVSLDLGARYDDETVSV